MDYCQRTVEALAAEQNRLRDALGSISKLLLNRSITYEDARNLDIVIGRKMWIDYYKQQEKDNGSWRSQTDRGDSNRGTGTGSQDTARGTGSGP